MIIYNLNFFLTPDRVLPAGLRGESNHHLAHLSSWQVHKLTKILLLLIRLSTRDRKRSGKQQEFFRAIF